MPPLIIVWSLVCSPSSQPTLAYGLAQDKGFIWDLKWCPAGGWEPSNSGAKVRHYQSHYYKVQFGMNKILKREQIPQAPLMPRLGLLAVASSTGVVTVYSLPHPEALRSSQSEANGSEDAGMCSAGGSVAF